MQSFHCLTNDLKFLLPQTNFPSDEKETLLKLQQISLLRQLRSLTRNCFLKGNLGKFQLKYIANIDQTPLPFVLDGNSLSDTVTAEETWVPDA